MIITRMTRRTFLILAALAGMAKALGSKAIQLRPPGNGRAAFKRSGRRRRISRAAKAHNANHLYANPQAAWGDPAHPGDRSRVVAVVISQERYKQYFGTGQQIVDLRHVGRRPIPFGKGKHADR